MNNSLFPKAKMKQLDLKECFVKLVPCDFLVKHITTQTGCPTNYVDVKPKSNDNSNYVGETVSISEVVGCKEKDCAVKIVVSDLQEKSPTVPTIFVKPDDKESFHHEFVSDPKVSGFKGKTEKFEQDQNKRRENKKRFICDVQGCGKGFTSRMTLQRHFDTLHVKTDKPFYCKIQGCDQSFTTKFELNTHIITVERRFVCKYDGCSLSFLNKSALHTHRSKHPRKPKVKKKWKPIPVDIVCQKCGKSMRSQHFKDHIISCHEGRKKSNICSYCGKGYSTERNLKAHVRSHLGIQPFSCIMQGCDRSFYTKSALMYHLKWHLGDKSFFCEYEGCDKKYYSKSQLNLHYRAHVKRGMAASRTIRFESNFVCDVEGCGKTFTFARSLRRHKEKSCIQLLSKYNMGIVSAPVVTGCKKKDCNVKTVACDPQKQYPSATGTDCPDNSVKIKSEYNNDNKSKVCSGSKVTGSEDYNDSTNKLDSEINSTRKEAVADDYNDNNNFYSEINSTHKEAATGDCNDNRNSDCEISSAYKVAESEDYNENKNILDSEIYYNGKVTEPEDYKDDRNNFNSVVDSACKEALRDDCKENNNFDRDIGSPCKVSEPEDYDDDTNDFDSEMINSTCKAAESEDDKDERNYFNSAVEYACKVAESDNYNDDNNFDGDVDFASKVTKSEDYNDNNFDSDVDFASKVTKSEDYNDNNFDSDVDFAFKVTKSEDYNGKNNSNNVVGSCIVANSKDYNDKDNFETQTGSAYKLAGWEIKDCYVRLLACDHQGRSPTIVTDLPKTSIDFELKSDIDDKNNLVCENACPRNSVEIESKYNHNDEESGFNSKLVSVLKDDGLVERYKTENVEHNVDKRCGKNKKPFICDVSGCVKRFKSKWLLRNHIDSLHTNTGKHFNCKIKGCGQSFTTKFDLNTHMLTVERRFVCKYDGCGLIFLNKSALYSHKSKHPPKPKVKKKWKPIPVDILCQKCGKLMRSQNFKDHKITCHEEKKKAFNCSSCGKGFSTARNLHAHSQSHSGIQPFSCIMQGCDRRFYTKSALMYHLKWHVGEKSFFCEHEGCDKKYYTISQLNFHYKAHAKRGPAASQKLQLPNNFVCNAEGCGKTFTIVKSLKRHQKRFHESKI